MKKGRKKLRNTTDGEFAEEIIPPSGESVKSSAAVFINTLSEFLSGHKLFILKVLIPGLYCLIFGSAEGGMGTYPFGVSAILAAGAGRPAFAAAIGTVLSSLFVRGGIYIGAFAAISALVLYLIDRFGGKTDDTGTRVILSLIAGTLQATVYSLSGGVSFYEICGIVLSAALCPVLTASLKGLFMGDASAEPGIYATMYTLLYVLNSASLAGSSAAIIISATATLYATYAFGIHRGVAAGSIAGLAAAPGYSMIYTALAAVSGSLMKLSPIGAVSAGIFAAIAFGIRSAGAEAFGTLFPELMFSAAVAGPVLHYRLLPSRVAESPPQSVHTADSLRLDYTKRRLRALSDGLGSVGCTIRRMAKIFSRPSYSELRQMCDEAFDESCQRCRDRGICWDKEYRATAAAVGKMAAELRRGRSPTAGILPDGVRNRCQSVPAILTRINIGNASQTKVATGNDGSFAMAEDLSTVSRLLSQVEEDAENNFTQDKDSSDRLTERLRSMGLKRIDASVYGSRRLTVILSGLEHGCLSSGEELHSAAQSVLNCSLSMPDYKINGRFVSAEMHSFETLQAEAGRFSLAKRGEQCGDSITAFKGDGGYFYALISDGMGSGGEAAATSGTCAVFLEKMLSAGCTLTGAVELLNGFLTRRNTECFATVDLLECDLITGDLRFLKSGAAPSFILRDGKLFRLESRTVPVGIMATCDGEILKFTVRGGDFIIMLSDGVLPDGSDPSWMFDMLCKGKPYLSAESDLTASAEGIAKAAAEHHGYADDVTVGIIRIKNA